MLPKPTSPTQNTQNSTVHLQELSQKTDKAEAHGSGVDVQHGSGAGVAGRRSAAGAARGITSVGILVVRSASELALDVAISALGLRREALEGCALIGDIGGGGQGKGTNNVGNLWHGDTEMESQYGEVVQRMERKTVQLTQCSCHQW